MCNKPVSKHSPPLPRFNAGESKQHPPGAAPHPKKTGLSRGELARRAEMHPETIRFYERCGLLPPPPRTPAGHRLYSAAVLEVLDLVKRLRHLGFSLSEVRMALDLCSGRESAAAGELAELLLELDAKVDRLHALLRARAPTEAR